jgi:hypothetical protein
MAIEEQADGSNYREDEAGESELADGSNYREDAEAEDVDEELEPPRRLGPAARDRDDTRPDD